MNFIIKNVINLIEIKNSGENEASYKEIDIFLAGHPSSKFSIEHVIHCFKINELSRLDRSGIIVKRMNYSFTQRVTNDLYI